MISWLNKFILVFYLLSTCNAPQNDCFIPPARSPLVAPALISASHSAGVFLVDCCMWNIVTWPLRPRHILLLYFFVLLNLRPRTKRQHPPTHTLPQPPSLSIIPPVVVGTLPDRYLHTNLLPQVPTKQSVPLHGKRLPPYLGVPVLFPALRRLIRPAIVRVRIPSWSTH